MDHCRASISTIVVHEVVMSWSKLKDLTLKNSLSQLKPKRESIFILST